MAVVYCTKCGAANHEARGACAMCYAALRQAPGGNVCLACNSDNPGSAFFCGACGVRIGETAAGPAMAPVAPAAPEFQAAPPAEPALELGAAPLEPAAAAEPPPPPPPEPAAPAVDLGGAATDEEMQAAVADLGAQPEAAPPEPEPAGDLGGPVVDLDAEEQPAAPAAAAGGPDGWSLALDEPVEEVRSELTGALGGPPAEAPPESKYYQEEAKGPDTGWDPGAQQNIQIGQTEVPASEEEPLYSFEEDKKEFDERREGKEEGGKGVMGRLFGRKKK